MRMTASASARLPRRERAHELAVAEQRLRALRVGAQNSVAELARDARRPRASPPPSRGRLGGLDDHAVELLVEHDLVGDRRLRWLSRGVAQLVEPRERARRSIRVAARARRVRLDQRADLVEVEQVVGVERADDRAAVGQHVDEALALEHQQRLADRRARGAEAAGERLGPQPLAGRRARRPGSPSGARRGPGSSWSVRPCAYKTSPLRPVQGDLA